MRSPGEDSKMAPRDPVFIVGGARSGTTFLAKLFDSHPDVLYRHEPDSVLVNTQIPFVPRTDEFEQFAAPARRYLETLCHVSATKVSGQAPFFEKSYRSGLQRKCFLANLYLTKAAERLCGPLRRNPLSVAEFINGTDERVLCVMKSVDSPWRTPLFAKAMPNLRVVHIVRHPCAVVNSRLRGIENRLMGSSTYLRPPFEAGMAEGYPFMFEELEAASFEEKTAFLWMLCNQWIHDELESLGRYSMVVYEDLCRDLEATTRRLFEGVGLAWSLQTQKFIDDLEASDRRDAGYFSVLRPPLTSLTKWREQLSGEQIARIERMVSHSEIGRRFLGDSMQDGRQP